MDDIFCVATQEQAHALQSIDAAHEPQMEPQHVAAIERGAVARDTTAPIFPRALIESVARCV